MSFPSSNIPTSIDAQLPQWSTSTTDWAYQQMIPGQDPGPSQAFSNDGSASMSSGSRKRAHESDSSDNENVDETSGEGPILPFPARQWAPCEPLGNYQRINRIDEGTYGTVSRGKAAETGAVVALKTLKAFDNLVCCSVSSLREIQILKTCSHESIVDLIEVVTSEVDASVTIVLEFLEHDLSILQKTMEKPFTISEIKTIVLQITSGLDYLHKRWIIHRDLKTANVLIGNEGQIKLVDFGMARFFSDPPVKMTMLVTTLWYRAPEVLLGDSMYGTKIDIWALGCIFGELLIHKAILRSKDERTQIRKIVDLLGFPTDSDWPECRRLEGYKTLALFEDLIHETNISDRFADSLSKDRSGLGLELLTALLSWDPQTRPTASDVLDHKFFPASPKPKSKAMFPTFPSKANLERQVLRDTPEAPRRGKVELD